MDGKYHELKVEVKRPGVRLHYRKGYMALADVKPLTLQEALASPISHGGIGLTVQLRAAPGGGTEMAVNIDATHVTLEERDGKWSGELELSIVQQPAGKSESAVGGPPLRLKLDLTPETYRKAREMGIFATAKVAFEPGATLHIGVRDVPSGETGTLHVHRK